MPTAASASGTALRGLSGVCAHRRSCWRWRGDGEHDSMRMSRVSRTWGGPRRIGPFAPRWTATPGCGGSHPVVLALGVLSGPWRQVRRRALGGVLTMAQPAPGDPLHRGLGIIGARILCFARMARAGRCMPGVASRPRRRSLCGRLHGARCVDGASDARIFANTCSSSKASRLQHFAADPGRAHLGMGRSRPGCCANLVEVTPNSIEPSLRLVEASQQLSQPVEIWRSPT